MRTGAASAGSEGRSGAGVSIEPRSLCSGSVHCSEQFQDVLWASDILLFLEWFLILTLTGPEVTRVLGEAEIIVWVMGWGGCQDKCLNRHFEINFGAGWRSGLNGPALKSPVWLLNHKASNQRKEAESQTWGSYLWKSLHLFAIHELFYPLRCSDLLYNENKYSNMCSCQLDLIWTKWIWDAENAATDADGTSLGHCWSATKRF